MEWKPALTYQGHVFNITCEVPSQNIIISPYYARVEGPPLRASIGDCANETQNRISDHSGCVLMY